MKSKTGIKVQLTGEDCNIFAIMGRVLHRMKEEGIEKEIQDKYIKEVTAAEGYDGALFVTCKYVDAHQ